VYHPLLFAAFPVLFLFARNLKEGVTGGDLALPLLVSVGAAALLWVAGTPLLRSAAKAGLVVSAWTLLFFSYGHIWLVAKGADVFGFVVGRHAVMLAVWGILGLGILVVAIRAGGWLPTTTRVLNAVAVILVALNLGTIVIDAFTAARKSAAALPAEAAPAPAPAGARDVVYIILDRYAGEQTLERYYGYDNTPFLDALRDRGFFVPESAWGNYPRSTHSMASSLNMRHLHFLRGQPGSDPRPLAELYDAPAAARFLKARGYRYVNIGTWWSVTREDPYADENIELDAPSRFSSILVDTTMLKPFADRFGWLRRYSFRKTEFRRSPFQFEQIARVGRDRRPTFTFAHLLLPHEPFVFDRDGTYLRARKLNSRSRATNYVNQLQHTNSRVLDLFDQLLAVPESQRPIIILQSDEGPEPLETNKRITAWGKVTLPMLEQKMRILNAYYFPGAEEAGLYDGITPVNSFRVLFNTYFGAGLPLLPDKTYVFSAGLDQYNFQDVTQKLRALDRAA
jgi:hypothetical protein